MLIRVKEGSRVYALLGIGVLFLQSLVNLSIRCHVGTDQVARIRTADEVLLADVGSSIVCCSDYA